MVKVPSLDSNLQSSINSGADALRRTASGPEEKMLREVDDGEHGRLGLVGLQAVHDHAAIRPSGGDGQIARLKLRRRLSCCVIPSRHLGGCIKAKRTNKRQEEPDRD